MDLLMLSLLRIILTLLLLVPMQCLAASKSTTSVRSKDNTLNLTRRHILDEAVVSIPSDFVEMGMWLVEHPVTSLTLVGVTVGLITVDKPTTEFIQNNLSSNWSPPKPWYVPPGAANEDAYLLAGLGGLYIVGNIFDSPINQVAAIASAKSVAYSVVISQGILKTIFGRIRPNPWLSNPDYQPDGYTYTNNNWAFFSKFEVNMKPVSGPTSMPSFHFTEFFAVGAALSEAYNSYWPYLITAAGLLPNMEGHHHWTSDMFAGAAIGLLIGYSTAHNLKVKLGLAEESNFKVEPDLKTRGVKLSFSKVFD